VLGQREGNTVVDAYDLEDAVAAKEAFVGDRDNRLSGACDVPVEARELVAHAREPRA
jgi:hypothetical protein